MATNEDDIATGEVELDESGALALGLDDLLRLRDAVDELMDHPDFHLHKFDTFQPTSDVMVSMVESAAGIAVPSHILSFFREISDGLDLSWSLIQADTTEGGSIAMYNFARVFGTWVDEVWGVVPDHGTPKDTDFSWELRPVEAPFPGGTHFTVMHVPEFAPTYNLYYHDPRGTSHRLSIDFLEYFSCLMETRGFHGWQFLVSDVDFDTHRVARERAEAFHRVMPQMFPETDFSRYRKP